MTKAQKPKQELDKRPEIAVASERFVGEVERRFIAEMGSGVEFTSHERKLAQHLYIKVDAALKAAEDLRIKRNQKDKAPFTWQNVNLTKLAIDAVHRVSLGLDALIPNHLHAIAYWNSKAEVYDIDLRIGYVGMDYTRRKLAIEPPIDVTYELVYETDVFTPHPRSATHPVETYDFEIDSPFDRGKVVGGFGYISYEDERKNRLVLVTPRDFTRSRAASKSDFWKNNDLEMMYKTVVHRVTSRIPLDPEKVNAASYAIVEAQERAEDFEGEVAEQANRQLVDTARAPRNRDHTEQHSQAPWNEPDEPEPVRDETPDAESESREPEPVPEDGDVPTPF